MNMVQNATLSLYRFCSSNGMTKEKDWEMFYYDDLIKNANGLSPNLFIKVVLQIILRT